MSRQADLERRLAQHGVVGSGYNWLIKALHPPSEGKNPGLPDESSTSVLRPEYRVQYTIEPPAGINTSTWDAYLWVIPGDVNTLVWATGPAGTDFSSNTVPAGGSFGSMLLQPTQDYSGSVTFVDRTGAGTVVPTSRDGPSSFPLAFRHVYKSVTVELNAAAVADQGVAYSAQFAPLKYTGNAVGRMNVNSVTGFNNYAFHTTFAPPLNELDLMAMSPSHYTGLAKAGCFMPMRLSGPSQPFAMERQASAAWYPSLGATGMAFPSGYQSWGNVFPSYPVAGSEVIQGNAIDSVWWTPTDPQNLNYAAKADTGYDNMHQGVMVFRGLSAGSPFGASLTVKVLVGLEIVPAPSTPGRVFASPALPYDPRAMDAYYALSLELADAFPASYNFFGGILDKVREVATALWPTVKSVGRVIATGLDSVLAPPPQPKMLMAPPPPRKKKQAVRAKSSSTRRSSSVKKTKFKLPRR